MLTEEQPEFEKLLKSYTGPMVKKDGPEAYQYRRVSLFLSYSIPFYPHFLTSLTR